MKNNINYTSTICATLTGQNSDMLSSNQLNVCTSIAELMQIHVQSGPKSQQSSSSHNCIKCQIL